MSELRKVCEEILARDAGATDLANHFSKRPAGSYPHEEVAKEIDLEGKNEPTRK